jgi:Uma2 family endonuclease
MTALVRHPAASLQLRKPHRKRSMAYQEFLAADLGHDHFEWLDGEVVEMPAVEDDHADLSDCLSTLLSMWIEAKDGGKVREDPFQMRLPSRPSGGQPDIQVILAKNLRRLKRMYLDGPADVVIEIVSTASREIKFAEYRDAGVHEYWMIDPERKQAEFYVLQKKRLPPAPVDDEGRFHSRVLPGVWLEADWLWKRPANAGQAREERLAGGCKSFGAWLTCETW